MMLRSLAAVAFFAFGPATVYSDFWYCVGSGTLSDPLPGAQWQGKCAMSFMSRLPQCSSLGKRANFSLERPRMLWKTGL
jgi:hypothetical protein